jgi:hypothetical protein
MKKKDEENKKLKEKKKKKKIPPPQEQKPQSLSSSSSSSPSLSSSSPIIFNSVVSSEIEFIKPSDDVKIQERAITFTKDGYNHTVFINKIIESGIMRMFISFFLNFYIYTFYFFREVLCIRTNNHDFFSMKNNSFLF